MSTLHCKKSSPSTHECIVCATELPSKVEFFRHMFTHREKQFPCSYCGEILTFVGLQSHILKEHSVTNCKVCDEVFDNSQRLQHKACLSNVKHTTFQYNQKTYIKKQETLRDTKIKNKREPEEVTCHFCDERMPVQMHLLGRSIVESSERQYNCKVCNRRFKINCIRRLKDKHRGVVKVPVYRCDLCRTTFSDLEILNGHLNEMHRNLSSFECKTCKLKFGSLAMLKGHNRKRHGMKQSVIKLKPNYVVCRDCGRKFVSLNRFKRHVALKHTVTEQRDPE